jgi:type II secretory pathway pseudopilin PulG
MRPIIIMLSLLIIVIVVVAGATTAAYAQQAILMTDANEHTQMLISEAIRKLQNAAQNQEDTLSTLGVHDDGALIIIFNNGTTDYTDDATIMTRHNYTPANGYEFRGQEIIKPDGTELFE